MSLPYERPNQAVEVTSTTDLYELPAPSRQSFNKLIAFRDDDGLDSHSEDGAPESFSIEVFNRAFMGPVTDIVAVESNGAGKCRLFLASSPQAKVGDPLLVDGCDVVEYNLLHRIVSIEKLAGGYRVVTNRNYTTRGVGGTAQLHIAAEEEESYRVIETQAASSGVVKYNTDDGLIFENQDPKRHDGSSYERKIYLRFSRTGSYRVTLGFRSCESFG